ncbi:hypothetical protein GCM10022280_09280 [Sphingomonas swuensis]|uniref:Uncharacterized protein n=1 Tax=Sphingomonas swuensis TaxID=977800 RepID=A0ABP7SLF7_9SPHN
MGRYRSHLSRWHVIRSALLITFATALLLYNVIHIWSGLSSGAIKELGRGTEMVRLASDSLSFGLNVSFRLFFALLCGGAVVVIWVKLRRERSLGMPD